MSNRRESVLAALYGQPWAILPEVLDRLILSAGDTVSGAARPAVPAASEKCAVIPIIGPIVPHASWFDDIFGVVSLGVLNARLDAALADPGVGRIALYIDSPGGQATGIHEFASRIRLANKVKPVVAYVYGMACSAAYWIASAAEKIVADRTAEVGSIGVIYAWTDDTDARKARGLRDDHLESTQSPEKYLDPNTPEGRAKLQALADELADIFIDDVAAYRGVTRGRVANKFGRGRVMMAGPALAAGMIDEIGIFEAILAGTVGKSERSDAMNLYMPNPEAKGKPKGRSGNDDEEENENNEEQEGAGAESGGGDDDDDQTGAGAEGEGKDGGEEEDEGGGKSGTKKTGADMTLDQFKAQFPAAFRAAGAAGAQRERKRIQSIFQLGVAGHDDLVREALFGAKPMQARDLAYAVALKQKEAAEKLHGDMRMDATEAQVVGAAVSPASAGSEAAWEKRLVNAMSGGLKGEM